MIVPQSFGERFVCIRLILFELCVKEKKKNKKEAEERRRRKKNKIKIFAFDFLDCDTK